MQAFEFFKLLAKLSFKSNLKFRHFKIIIFSLLFNHDSVVTTTINVFKHLQLKSIKIVFLMFH